MSRFVRVARISAFVVAFAFPANRAPASAQTLSAPEPLLGSTVVDTPPPAPDSRLESGPSFGSLFKDTVTDFRRLPSMETATLFGIGALAATLGHQADRNVTSSLSGSRQADEFFEAGKVIGGASMQLGGAFAALAIGRAIGSRETATIGFDLIRAQIVTQTITGGMKGIARRSRPDGTDFSFPSGHSSGTFAAATVLQRHLGWKVGAPAYAVATYVATSRIQERRHFLSDVVFGAAIGIVAGRTVTIGVGNHRFTMEPRAALRGGGVRVTW